MTGWAGDAPSGPQAGRLALRGEPEQPRAEGPAFDPDEIIEIVHWRTAGIALQAIHRMCVERFDGRQPEPGAVDRWVEGALAERRAIQNPTSMPDSRARALLTLDMLDANAKKIIIMYPGTELSLKATTASIGIHRERVSLLGMQMPVRHDISHTVYTAEEKELLDAVERAKVEQAAREAVVIEQSGADDL